MPRVFRGYPCRMKQAVKAATLILFVSLLTGCSSAEDKACKLAVETNANFVKEADDLYSHSISQESPSLFELAGKTALKASKVIVNNPQCFTPKQVVEAQLVVDNKYNK